MLRLRPLAVLLMTALLAVAAPLRPADAPPTPPAPPAPPENPEAPPAGEKPADPKPTPPPIPADGMLLRYKYIHGQTLKLKGTIAITQTYQQSDQEKPVDREAKIDVDGEMIFLQITPDGQQAVAESRVKSTTAGETTFTKSMQRIDARGQVLSDQSDLPPPTPEKGLPSVTIPAAHPAANPDAQPTGEKPAAPAAPAAPTAPAPAAAPAAGDPPAPAGETPAPRNPPRPPVVAKSADSAPLQVSRLVFPDGKVKVGDSWTRESFHVQTGAAGAPRMKDLLTVTVKDIRPDKDHNIVVLDFKLISTPVDTIANLKSSTTTAQGTSEFDLENGVVVKCTVTTDTTAQAVTDGVESTLKIRAQADYAVTLDTGSAAPGGGRPGGGGRGPRGNRGPRSGGGPPGGPGGGGGGP